MSKPIRKFTVRNAFTRGTALTVIAALDLSKVWIIKITLYNAQEGITDAQRRLYWQCMEDLAKTDINELAGNDKNYWHRRMKRKFLIDLYAQNDSDFGEMVDSVRAVKQHDNHAYLIYLKFLFKETSIIRKFETDETTGESGAKKSIRVMREYLTLVMDWARNRGVLLKIDRRVFEEAMGYGWRS